MNHTSKFIQDVSEFVRFILMDLCAVIDEIKAEGLPINHYIVRDSIYYILVREIDLVYNLFPTNEPLNKDLFDQIYNRLKMRLSIPISTLISHYIKAPKIYGDYNQVTIMFGYSYHFSELTIVYHFERNKFGEN